VQQVLFARQKFPWGWRLYARPGTVVVVNLHHLGLVGECPGALGVRR
jgi:hypothetical protein